VAEETLRDVMMHNRAKSATVGVSATDRSVQIDVAYDCLTPERNGEAGLCGVLAPVKDRVMLAGGRMKIETAGNGRTHVTAELQKTESA
jgi:signal transduction histidine kinase